MRLFVALELPDAERQRLAGFVRRTDWFGFEGGILDWVRPENLHVTLKFLGEVPDTKVPAVCDALKGVSPAGPLTLRIEGVTFFPPRGALRVFVAEIGGDGARRLVAIQDQIERALEPIGFLREARPFRPHVTLARARRRGRRLPGVVRDLVRKHPIPLGDSFTVESFVLMNSDLKPTGPVYSPVARFPLAGT